mmetsp:Transcript_181/g.400  ORF Transcript_181/g.400 Transcript_181/m.400 type:complete len:222 (-) Transcript_181:580-1245(-)
MTRVVTWAMSRGQYHVGNITWAMLVMRPSHGGGDVGGRGGGSEHCFVVPPWQANGLEPFPCGVCPPHLPRVRSSHKGEGGDNDGYDDCNRRTNGVIGFPLPRSLASVDIVSQLHRFVVCNGVDHFIHVLCDFFEFELVLLNFMMVGFDFLRCLGAKAVAPRAITNSVLATHPTARPNSVPCGARLGGATPPAPSLNALVASCVFIALRADVETWQLKRHRW